MSFAADIRHFPTVEAFEAYLAEIDPARVAWVKGLTLHHTIVPTLAQWHGRGSVEGLRNYYKNEAPWTDAQGRVRKGWSAGPHLFIGPDGIWQLTPVTVPGIHAVSFNDDHWGMEVVGTYDKIAWQEPLRSLVFGAAAALLRWRGLSASAVNGHRDDPKTTKSCPGWAIDLDKVRAELATMLAPAAPTFAPTLGYTEHSSLLGAPQASAAQCLRWLTPRVRGEYTAGDVALIVNAYWKIGAVGGIDPVLAIAQMAHETGSLSSWWAARPRRNPAGIGVTGETAKRKPATGAWEWNPTTKLWHEGVAFASWEARGIPAQIGRLLAYALRDTSALPAQRTLIGQALAVRPLHALARGTAPTLKPLGAIHNPANAGLPRAKWVAGWAWDGADYGERIAALANAIRATPA